MRTILFICLSCLSLFGCESVYQSPFSENNGYVREVYCHYSNDSLKVSVDFYWDYWDYEDSSWNVIEKDRFNLYVQTIERNYPGLKIEKQYFVIGPKTNDPPYIHSALFYVPQYNDMPDTIFLAPHNNTVLYSKNDTVHKGTYILVFNLDKRYENNDLFDELQTEAKDISSTLTIGDNYKKSSVGDPFAIANSAFVEDSANYLKPGIILESIKANYQTGMENQMWHEAALTYHSFIRNNSFWERNLSGYYHPQDSIINASMYDDETFEFLMEQIKGERLVIMNEQHFQPKHRYLGNILLKYLYDEGFRYLAVETLWGDSEQDLINTRKYPLQSSGFYTKEPTYGNFVRDALHMGFKIIKYEPQDNFKEREYKQANAIYENTFQQDPESKVFVWCGIGHILEHEREKPMMAYLLKKRSGIDPLTINQTSGDVKSAFLGDHYLAINTDTIGLSGSDIYIYNHIKENDFAIRPDTEQKVVTVSLSKNVIKEIKQHKQILLMVYNKEEFEAHRFEAIPVLNYLVESYTILTPRDNNKTT